jgi:hypothetical protein
MKPEIIFRRQAKGHHHSWTSRDYEDIDCRATGCLFNTGSGKCIVPSKCKIDEKGSCAGFEAKPLPPAKSGD